MKSRYLEPKDEPMKRNRGFCRTRDIEPERLLSEKEAADYLGITHEKFQSLLSKEENRWAELVVNGRPYFRRKDLDELRDLLGDPISKVEAMLDYLWRQERKNDQRQ